jgi:hypothetical protein
MSEVAGTVMKYGYFGRLVIIWPCAIGTPQGVCLSSVERKPRRSAVG